MSLQSYDVRERELTIKGQEILTADKERDSNFPHDA